MAKARPLAIFFAIAYAWAWVVFVPMVVFRAPLQWVIAASFGPTVAALITHRVTTGSWRAFRILTTWRRTGTQQVERVRFDLVMALCGLATAVVLIVATRGRLAYREDSAES